MKKAPTPIVEDPEFEALFMGIKTLIRSYQQKRKMGAALPEWLTNAAGQAVIHGRSVRITDSRMGSQVLVIPPKWIPLFERLEGKGFTHAEIVALEDGIPDEERTTEKRSKEIVAWAEALK